MKRKLITLICLLSMALTLSAPVSALTATEQTSRMDEIISLIERAALDYRGEDVLRQGLERMFERDPQSFDKLMDAILSAYGSHSMYLPEGTYSSAFPNSETYVGIGVTLTAEGESVTVSAVNPAGPAAETGLLPGDIILKVDGRDVKGKTSAEIAAMTRGEAGKAVSLTVSRGDMTFTFKITRREIVIPNLTGEMLQNGVYYMKITRFAELYTYIMFTRAKNQMEELGAKALILDLRGNPGGEVNMAVNFIDRLIPEKDVEFFTLRGRYGEDYVDETFYSNGIGIRLNKIVILCDGGSASCSEIMASSLRDTGKAVLVGEKTYGKARGQSHMVFSDGAAAVLTTVRLMSPSGFDYEGVGLTPDKAVSNRQVPHPAAACRSLNFRKLSQGAKGQNLERLSAALKAMGYLPEDFKADSLDAEVMKAVNELRARHGLDSMTFVNAETVNIINSSLSSLSRLKVTADDQMAAAVALAEQYAKQ